MPEWWTYRPEDFLLFSPRVYWRMFDLHNADFWPLHLVAVASGLVLFLLMLRQKREHDRWIALILAVIWIFIGWSFVWSRYAAINWAVAYVAPAFGLQALLLLIAAARGGLDLERTGIAAWTGRIVVTLSLVVYPLLPAFFGRPWTNAEVFGIAPDPTAMATLCVLLVARGRLALLLFPVPLAWLLLSGVTLFAMGDPQGWIPLLSAAAVIAVLILRPHPARSLTPD